MLRRSKALSIVMTLCLCMALLAPVFVAPPAANASSTYTAIRTESVSDVGTYLTKPRIQIDVPNVAALSDGDLVTIHLPSDLVMDNDADDIPTVSSNNKQIGGVDANVEFYSETNSATPLAVNLVAGTPIGATYTATAANNPTGGPNVRVWAPSSIGADSNAFNYAGAAAPCFVAYPVGDSAIEIKITTSTGPFLTTNMAGRLYIDFVNCKVDNSFDGDISSNVVAPAGSGFSSGSVVIANYIGGGDGTVTVAKSVVTMGTGKKALDAIMIQEKVKNTLKPGNEITLKLPKGFKWSYNAASDALTGSWAFTNSASLTDMPAMTVGAAGTAVIDGSDTRKMVITMPLATGVSGTAGDWTGSDFTYEGRLYFYGSIEVDDEDEADLGDVVVTISGDNVTTQDVTVAKYAEYGVTVTEKTSEEVKAGWADTELGSFNVKENMGGSIVPGRTVTFELPSGVEWDDANYTTATCYSTKVYKGTDWATAATKSFNKNGNVLKFSLAAGAIAKSDIDFKDFKVRISPDFSGDLKIKVGGTAGIEGEVKVATVVTPVTLSIEKVSNIIIGKQGQVIEPILLKEGKKEAIKATVGPPAANVISLRLPDGATFDKLPKVEVTDGDILIDKVSYSAAFRRNGIDIITKGTSDKLSTIKLSDVVVTADRTVPEGDFELFIDAALSSALTDQAGTFNVSEMGELVIGKCVTPAPADGTAGAATGQFRIDSNIYQVNGVSKVMDAAPYIKNNRTYVPVRFLGYAMGLTDADIVWDEATQKVTFTQGSNVVELTIGSTTYTVNGESKTMDVAPEITNSRTMLPARYVAEGLGYVVGWDPATQTVLVSK